MAIGHWSSGMDARLSAAYTYAQLSALAAAGGLTPHSWYVAVDSGVRYWAPDAFTLEPDASLAPLVDSMIYNGAGQPISGTLSRVACEWSYDAQGRVETITQGGVDYTVTYDGDGRVHAVAAA